MRRVPPVSDRQIRDGTVVAGTGNPRFRAGIGVNDGSIAAADRIEGKAERVIRWGNAGPARGRGDPHRAS